MTILLSGGGTGGHITPILSVAHELKQLDPTIRIVYVGERGSKLRSMLQNSADIDETVTVFAGKFRRYHNESWLKRLLDVKTNVLNVRDALFVLFGLIQSVIVLGKYRPQAVFLKGGFVGVPVGLAAGVRKIPLVTHDSDAVAGLANRLVSRYVTLHATALPVEHYPYPENKTLQVGVIVAKAYQWVDSSAKSKAKQELGIPKEAVLLLVTGGSTGAVAVNAAMEQLYEELFNKHSNLYIIHQTGQGKAGEPGAYDKYERLERLELLSAMHTYSEAADIIVMRAGANTLAEFAVQGKACIVIPSPHLPGGHQLKNAAYFNERNAAMVLDQAKIEKSPQLLASSLSKLITDKKLREQLAAAIHKEAHQDAGKQLAEMLHELATSTKKQVD